MGKKKDLENVKKTIAEFKGRLSTEVNVIRRECGQTLVGLGLSIIIISLQWERDRK